MQEKERFERYTPQFPLPTDITNMSRQDTVCQFCGVSYLIHNEIKALEAKCQKLESDLAFYAGINSREAALEQKLQTERTRVADLEPTVSIHTHKLNEFTRKLQLANDQLQQSQLAHRETKSSFLQCSSNLRSIKLQLENLRKEHFALKDFYSKQNQDWKTFLQLTQNNFHKEININNNKYTKQINHYQQQFNETNQTLRDIQVKYQQIQIESKDSRTKIENDLETKNKEIEIHQNELSHLRQQLSKIELNHVDLQNHFDQLKQTNQQLEKQLNEKDQSKRNLDLLIDQHRQQFDNEKQLRINIENQLEILRTENSKLKTDYEQLNQTKNEFEINETNIRKKNEEVNRSRQAILDRTRDEYEKLLRKYNDLDEIYRELVQIREKESSEFETIRRELERLHNENIELNKQKETTSITHDIQLKKLHDNYSTKLRDAEQWPDRLQFELNQQREQHRIQINELERRLKENFLTELNIEKEKTNNLMRKYGQDNDQSTLKLRHELVSTEKVTLEQRQHYEQQIEQLQHDKNQLKNELDTLRDVLKELHEQINNQGGLNNDRVNNLQLKEDLLSKETSLFQAQSIIADLRKELEQTREEMSTLQETVHKECTEREQLKDALIEARQQLLTMKKNGVLNGTVSRALHSPPVAFEEIERRVSGPLPYAYMSNQQPFAQSEPPTRDSSLPGDAADLMARPISSTQSVPYRHKTLPPIQPQHQQQIRRNGSVPAPNKTEQLLENQRRIARFIKHIK